jgi:hypothetical protein
MIETIITGVIILAAAVWFVRWLRGTASGEKGCSCGGCAKQDCPSRTGELTEEAQ